MFNLSEIINSAQDGKAVENLAQQFGITPIRPRPLCKP